MKLHEKSYLIQLIVLLLFMVGGMLIFTSLGELIVLLVYHTPSMLEASDPVTAIRITQMLTTKVRVGIGGSFGSSRGPRTAVGKPCITEGAGVPAHHVLLVARILVSVRRAENRQGLSAPRIAVLSFALGRSNPFHSLRVDRIQREKIWPDSASEWIYSDTME